MLELYNLGINEAEIKDVFEINPQIKNISSEQILKLITILKQIDCNDRIIRNIIITNPFYLTRLDTDIINLMNKLVSIGLRNLNILFDTNPYLLNKDAFEIDNFIKEQQKKYSLEEIVNIIDNNPYIIDEY